MSGKLEEIKNSIAGVLDEAWHVLEGTVDVEHARSYVGQLTATLKTMAEDAGEHLFWHVMGNANAPAEASNPSVPGQPDAAPIDETATPVTQPDAPSASAPDGSVQVPSEPVTGMAPAAGEPVAGTVETTDAPATDTTDAEPAASA